MNAGGPHRTSSSLATSPTALRTLRDDRTEADRDIRDRDGNRVYMVGKTVPLVVKLDAAGHVEWERSYRKKGFVDYGPGWVAEARNGDYLVMVPSYVHPGRWPVYRFLAVRATSGEIVWERQLRGSGGRNSPAVAVARLTGRGTLALEGSICRVRGWSRPPRARATTCADAHGRSSHRPSLPGASPTRSSPCRTRPVGRRLRIVKATVRPRMVGGVRSRRTSPPQGKLAPTTR